MALSLEFAFEGFRTLRQRPRLLWLWGVVTLIGNGLAVALFIALSGAPLESLVHLGWPADIATLERLLRRAAPGVFAGRFVMLVTTAIITAAICRAGLGEEDDGLGFLQFGARELQLILVQLVTQLAMLGLVVACVALASLPAFLLHSDDAAVLCLAAGLTTAAVLMLWLDIRLMFNSVQSFAEQRLAIFDSFALTREAFWTLFAGRLLAWTLALVVLFLNGQVISAVIAVVFGPDAAHPSTPDMTSLHAFFTQETLVSLVLTYGLVSPQILAISLGAPVAAFRAITGRNAAGHIETIV